MNMEKTTIIVSAVVGSLGLLSAILGFSAEGSKLTPYDILIYGTECIYPPNTAYALAICAAVFLLLTQFMVTAVGGCFGCCKLGSRAAPSNTKMIIGIGCGVVSWIAAVVALVLLLYGAAWNANVARPLSTFCPYLNDGVFAGAAVLTLVATALGVTSYIMLQGRPAAAASTEAPAASQTGAPDDKPQQPDATIATGHPQLPPPEGLSQQQLPPSYPPPTQGPQHHEEQAPFPPPTAPPAPRPEGYEQAIS